MGNNPIFAKYHNVEKGFLLNLSLFNPFLQQYSAAAPQNFADDISWFYPAYLFGSD